jgi:ribonuclease HII
MTSHFERLAMRKGHPAVAGADEVGRGCLFGPLVAAAVILDPARPIRGLADSKALTAGRREVLAQRIRERARAFSVAAVDAFWIDRLNIYHASRLALKQAIEMLPVPASFAYVDGNMTLDVAVPQRALVGGDARCASIAAASILAKVHRDGQMPIWHDVYPQYGLARNKGYSAPEHLRALAAIGPSAQHRFSFEPVRQAAGASRQAALFPEWTA